jgi:hypothetical protein
MPKGSIQEHAPRLRKNMALCFVSNLVFEWGGNDEHYACSLETANLEHYAFKVSSRSVERKDGGGTEELHQASPLAHISLIHPTSATAEFMPPHISGFRSVKTLRPANRIIAMSCLCQVQHDCSGKGSYRTGLAYPGLALGTSDSRWTPTHKVSIIVDHCNNSSYLSRATT